MLDRIQIFLAIGVLLGSLILTFRGALGVNRRLAVVDIGVWWLAFLAIYSIQPVLYWLVTGEYLSVATNRLELLRTSSSDFAEVVGISAWYAVAFVPAYFMMRPSRVQDISIARIGNDVLFPTVCLCILAWLSIRMLFPDLHSGTGYESKFLNLSQESLGARRIHKFALAFLIISDLILIVAFLQRRELRKWVLIWLPALVLLVNPGSSRGAVALLLIVFLISWHALVRPIPRIVWMLAALGGILAFNLLGAVRSYGYLPSTSEIFPWLIASGEFEHIFGNAVELRQAVRQGLDVPQTARFAELFAFVPSEYFSFDKTTLADWFMETFHPELKATGGGLAFGIMGQAVIGLGAIEAIVRGFIFGILLGLVSNYMLKNASRHWWVFPAYIYLLTRTFDSVRSTMFGSVSDLLQIFVPLIVLLCCASALLRALPEMKAGGDLRGARNELS
ncbi:MAG: hypothetical protein A4S14_06855 [Proteobacteria bacterium SG_bin9]|nr:MAG: hypothetical protein A4S14_06855 [Proteobacteria bacterium SG_bin9]